MTSGRPEHDDAYEGRRYGGPGGGDPYGADPYGADPYGADPYGVQSGTRSGAQGAQAAQGGGGGTRGTDPYGEPYADVQADPYGRSPYDAQYDPQYGASYGSQYDEPYGPQGGPGGSYGAAVDALADPLTDPLPGGTSGAPDAASDTSPWFRPHADPGADPHAGPHVDPHLGPHPEPRPGSLADSLADPLTDPLPSPGAQPGVGHGVDASPYGGYGRHGGHGGHGVPGAAAAVPRVEWGAEDHTAPPRGADVPGPAPSDASAGVSETAAMPVLDPASPAASPSPSSSAASPSTGAGSPGAGRASASAAPSALADEDEDRTMGLRQADEAALGGRAARRKAAAAKGRGRGTPQPAAAGPRAGTRLEARRAERARRAGPFVLLSRFIGEMFITLGVLMLLFVGYQLWWTNVLAHQQAGGAAQDLEDKWKQSPERKPGAFEAGQGFAIMYIPKLDVKVPVAEGIDKPSVLDKGMVGHYDEDSGLETAMPWDKKGNFAVAGHRNTHGEPFRYVNKLVSGDEIVVETADTYYVYEMFNRLPSTSPSNTGVIDPVPQDSGFEEPGRYITLTTCTPEFTSKYRLIVWGEMVEERPRSEGKPDALVE